VGDGPLAWTLAVLDDDPTGVQTLSGVRVLLRWNVTVLRALLGRASAIHLLTNSRALAANEARAVVADATRAIREADGQAAVVLRGDSTLRGHVLEEYLGIRDGRGTREYPLLLLAPALPSAGRVTVGGTQLLEQDGVRVPVHLTEFAHDGVFSYRNSRLLEWLEERSRGFFAASRGVEVDLHAIRTDGAKAVTRAIADVQIAAPTAIALDAETAADVEVIADGFRTAVQQGSTAVLRCGPAVAGALGRVTATSFAQMPHAEQVLVVCGSYVSQSRRQLEALAERHPEALIEVDPLVLASKDEAAARSAAEIRHRLRSTGIAVLATPEARPSALLDLDAGLRIARGLADIVRRADTPGAITVIKGGVTSAITIRYGLGADEADVVGPVLPGVALWRLRDDEHRARNVLVVPGNVGTDDLLVRVIDQLLSGTRT
jgi:uncharacterized protein YgbK (DUF1537 family)